MASICRGGMLLIFVIQRDDTDDTPSVFSRKFSNASHLISTHAVSNSTVYWAVMTFHQNRRSKTVRKGIAQCENFSINFNVLWHGNTIML